MDIGIVPGDLADFREDLGPFGVIGGSAAGQYELAIVIALHQLVGLNDADWIFQAVEARNLGQDWPAPVDAESLKHFGDELRLQVAIFLRQWIYRRVEQILWYRQLPG